MARVRELAERQLAERGCMVRPFAGDVHIYDVDPVSGTGRGTSSMAASLGVER